MLPLFGPVIGGGWAIITKFTVGALFSCNEIAEVLSQFDAAIPENVKMYVQKKPLQLCWILHMKRCEQTNIVCVHVRRAYEAIQELQPPFGPVSGGWTVTVIGEAFTYTDTAHVLCQFDALTPVSATVLNASAFTCITPAAAHGALSQRNVEISMDNGSHFTDHNMMIWYHETVSLREIHPLIVRLPCSELVTYFAYSA